MALVPRILFQALCGLVLAAALAAPARAQVTITLGHGGARVPSGRTCTFHVAHADGRPRAWYWSIELPPGVAFEASPGTFTTGQGQPWITYRAPMVVHGMPRFFIRATDLAGEGSGVFPIDLVPATVGRGTTALKALDIAVQPQVMGPHGLVAGPAAPPSAVPFAGVLPGARVTPGEPGPPFWEGGMCCVDAPSPSNPQGLWLAWNREAITTMWAPGFHARLPLRGRLTAAMPFTEADRFPAATIESVAALPPGGTPGGGRQMVVLLMAPPPYQGIYLCGLNPDGTVWPIAGRPGTPAELADAPVEGPGAEVAFNTAIALALDMQGTILVVETSGRIRRVSVTGEVTLLAGGPNLFAPIRDGRGREAVFREPRRCALDPATGDLYVQEGRHLIRRVSEDGTVRTVLGARPTGPMRPRPPMPATIAEDVFCLVDMLAMSFDRGILYLIDDGDFLAFNPRSRVLSEVIPTHPDLEGMRLGPLPLFSPALRASDCAAFGCFQRVVVQNGVGLAHVQNILDSSNHIGDGVIRFTLPPGAFGGGPREDKGGPATGPAAPPAPEPPPARRGPGGAAAPPPP